MNSPYSISDAAGFDFDEIMLHTMEAAGPAVALKVHDEIERGFERIAAHPHLIGHIRSDVPDERVRALRVFAYLIFYYPDTDPIEILRIIHGSRDIPAAFED